MRKMEHAISPFARSAACPTNYSRPKLQYSSAVGHGVRYEAASVSLNGGNDTDQRFHLRRRAQQARHDAASSNDAILSASTSTLAFCAMVESGERAGLTCSLTQLVASE